MSDNNFEDVLVNHSKEVKDYLGEGGYFQKNNPNFKVREGQLKMALAYEEALKEGRTIICEAATGTGKTFAYLIPAILSGKCTVITTASKALQDQLVNKDLPYLYKLLNLQQNYMSLKGFNNYLCLAKYFELSSKFLTFNSLNFGQEDKEQKAKKADKEKAKGVKSDSQLLDEGYDQEGAMGIIDKKTMAKLQLLIEKTEQQIKLDLPNIDFAEVHSKFPKQVVDKVTCSVEHCSKKRCKYFASCYPFRARLKAIHSKIVVINHSLFFASTQIEDVFNPLAPSILLPKYRNIIFDEAHALPSIGREHLSLSVSTFDVKKLKADLDFVYKHITYLPRGPFEEHFLKIKEAYSLLFAYLKKAEGEGENKRNFLFYKYVDYDEFNDDPYFHYQIINQEFRQKVGNLYKVLDKAYHFYHDLSNDYDEDFFNKAALYLEDKLYTIVNLMNIDDVKNKTFYGRYVATVNVGKKSFAFTLTPLEISDFFGNFLKKTQEDHLSVLLTSATLSVDHKFTKFKVDIGASKDTYAFEVLGCFDYQKQSMLYTSDAFSEVSLDDYKRLEKIVLMLKSTIENVDGGIFFLTTSIAALKAASAILYQHFSKERKIFFQNGNLSNLQMLHSFIEDGKAILVGTSSFWEGVDVQGKALSLVIIDKLPFENISDPIFKARCNFFDAKAEHKKNSFVSISLPEAVITLRQGAGRLIRHENDHGALIICDPRLKQKHYGKIFMRSLPNMKTTDSLLDLNAFLTSKK